MGKPVTGIAEDAARKLLDYSWPGNVRELQNCMERALVLARLDLITSDDLPRRLQQHEPRVQVVAATHSPELLQPLEEVERRYVLQALATLGGNKSLVAKVLKVDRRTLYRMLERWEGKASGDE
jgi:transcriptional regulator with PAS, ATPase and Fis domain